MLLNLHVKNLALIEEVDVDFTNGLIVLTGETGAGKSLLLGSVNLALGEKASKDLIRTGTDYSLVELTFSVDGECREKLKHLDIYIEDNNEVVVTRKISEGRSVAKINGETVNLKTLKEAMSLLLDIHGQHDHQTLLYRKNHLGFLDQFAKDDIKELINKVANQYEQYKKVLAQFDAMKLDDSSKTKELEFAKFEINEINSCDLKIGEDEELETEFRRVSNAEDTSNHLSQIHMCLNGNPGVEEMLDKSIASINQIKETDEELENFKKTLYDIESLTRQVSSNVYDYNQSLEYDSERVRTLEERLDIINKLKMKYGNTIEQILKYRDERQEFVDRISNYEEEIENITKELEESKTKLKKYADSLSKTRKEKAKEFEKVVKNALEDLNFLSVEFEVKFDEKEPSSDGIDAVEFLLSTNPGEEMKPLSNVASGGELSRIMLAIKSVEASTDNVDTLIFDEIDAGISGVTATAVADKLDILSKKNQVICISHLAQIAAMADSHYLISKTAKDNKTFSSVKKLDRDEEIDELVRLSGGDENSKASLMHARELKEKCESKKQSNI